MLTTLAFVCGMALGVRFNMFILVPAIPIACLVVGIWCLGMGASDGSVLLAMVLATVAVQAGYMVAIGLEWAVRAAHRWFVGRHWSRKPAAAPEPPV